MKKRRNIIGYVSSTYGRPLSLPIFLYCRGGGRVREPRTMDPWVHLSVHLKNGHDTTTFSFSPQQHGLLFTWFYFWCRPFASSMLCNEENNNDKKKNRKKKKRGRQLEDWLDPFFSFLPVRICCSSSFLFWPAVVLLYNRSLLLDWAQPSWKPLRGWSWRRVKNSTRPCV